jgi:hypothetical protein
MRHRPPYVFLVGIGQPETHEEHSVTSVEVHELLEL